MIVKGMNGRGMNSAALCRDAVTVVASEEAWVCRNFAHMPVRTAIFWKTGQNWRILALKSGVFHFKMHVRFAAKLNS
jgi:hypothetical protein